MLVLDTSALLKRYVEEDGTRRTIELMDSASEWCGSALCLAEARVMLCHLGLDDASLRAASFALQQDWDRFHVVPVDDLCLARAVEIGCEQRLRTLDAIHLAATDRLPPPVRFLTFDGRQADAARSLGLDVVAP